MPAHSARAGRRGPRWLAVVVATSVIVALVGVVGAMPAGAHAELTSSTPAEGSTVAGPVERIALEFLNPVVAVDEQFTLVDADGRTLPLARIEPDGETTTVDVIPTAPLEGGAYGLRWSARAGDSHPRPGTVTFTVEAAAPTTASPSVGDDTSATSVGGTTSEHPAGASGGHEAVDGLHEALAGSDTATASALATAVRFLVYAGLLLAVGGLLYLGLVHRGTRDEGRRLVFLVRRAAVLVLGATVLEIPVQAILFEGGSTDAIAAPAVYGDLLSGDYGVGVALRVLGAVLVLVGMRMQLDRLDGPEAWFGDGVGDEPTLEQPLGGHGGVATRVRPPAVLHDHRVRVEASPIALVGSVALVCSELFIGHTASAEPRWLVLTSTLVHLLAAALWVAGVAMLAATLWRRHRRGAELEAALLATRFSVFAVAAVAAVSVTGVALGIAILGDLGALTSTEFGRLLVVKTVLVGVLVVLGGYNQRVVIPSLERHRTARRAGHRLRWIVTAEVVTFLGVVALTAALVGADSGG